MYVGTAFKYLAPNVILNLIFPQSYLTLKK